MAGVITDADLTILRSLRERGCAVVVFEPEEMKGVRTDRLEDCMVEVGWNHIDWNSPCDDEEAE